MPHRLSGLHPGTGINVDGQVPPYPRGRTQCLWRARPVGGPGADRPDRVQPAAIGGLPAWLLGQVAPGRGQSRSLRRMACLQFLGRPLGGPPPTLSGRHLHSRPRHRRHDHLAARAGHGSSLLLGHFVVSAARSVFLPAGHDGPLPPDGRAGPGLLRIRNRAGPLRRTHHGRAGGNRAGGEHGDLLLFRPRRDLPRP